MPTEPYACTDTCTKWQMLSLIFSVAVLAEIPLRSPRKLFIFIIKIYIYRMKVSKKTINSILKKNITADIVTYNKDASVVD